MRHQVRLNLRPEVHGYHYRNQQCRPAQVEGHIREHLHKIWQQTNQRDVNRAEHRQAGNNAINVLCCLLTGANAGNKCTGPLQVLCHVTRIEHQRGLEKAEENNHGAENYDVQRLARPNQQRQVLQPLSAFGLAEPLAKRSRK